LAHPALEGLRQIPHFGREQILETLSPGPHLFAADYPYRRCPRTAHGHLPELGFAAIRSFRARLGLLVLGLEQRGDHLHYPQHHFDLASLCRHPQIPAPLVVLLLAGFSAHSAAGLLSSAPRDRSSLPQIRAAPAKRSGAHRQPRKTGPARCRRSEEHTSELQSPYDLVCRLLLEK